MLNQLLLLTLLNIPMQANTPGKCPAGEEIICEERKTEAALQAKYPGHIKRRGGKLIIRATSGKEHIFTDNRNENDDQYVAHIATPGLPGLDWIIVQTTYYEGASQDLINVNSGASFQFDGYGEPILSPDGKRLLVYSVDMDAGYYSNYISIYQIDQNNMKLEIELSGDSKENTGYFWGPDKPRWVNNETLKYDELRYVGENNRMQATHIKLKLINGKWQKSVSGKSAVRNH